MAYSFPNCAVDDTAVLLASDNTIIYRYIADSVIHDEIELYNRRHCQKLELYLLQRLYF